MKYKINNQNVKLFERIPNNSLHYYGEELFNELTDKINELIKALGTPVEEAITKARFYSKLTGKCLGIRDVRAELDENETWVDNKCANCSKLGQRGAVVTVTYDNLCTECNAEVNLKSFEAFNVVRKKELTIEERKAELEVGWEAQDNYNCLDIGFIETVNKEYFLKQKIIAKLNTVIDKLNEEEGWVEDWRDDYQKKYYLYYDLSDNKLDKHCTSMYKYSDFLNSMSENTANWILENYKDLLEELFNVK